MRAAARLMDVSFWLGLIAWVSALVTAGISAAMAFPTMHEFAVEVPKFRALDASEHWSIAAGLLMERIFTLTDMIQLVAALLVIVGLVGSLALGSRRRQRISGVLRALCVLGAAGLLAYRILVLAPSMNASLHSYWNAAEAGKIDVAMRHRADFQAAHPTASRIYGVMFAMLIAGAAITAWSPPTPKVNDRAATDLQEPELVRKMRR